MSKHIIICPSRSGHKDRVVVSVPYTVIHMKMIVSKIFCDLCLAGASLPSQQGFENCLLSSLFPNINIPAIIPHLSLLFIQKGEKFVKKYPTTNQQKLELNSIEYLLRVHIIDFLCFDLRYFHGFL